MLFYRAPSRQAALAVSGGGPGCISLKRRIDDAVEAAYQEGYRHFLCGMAQGCDLYFCEAVLALRSRHPDVTVEAAIPCPTQAEGWPPDQRTRYERLVGACDFETLVSDRYTSSCMQRRDRYMVDHASLLIAAFDGSRVGPVIPWSTPCGRDCRLWTCPLQRKLNRKLTRFYKRLIAGRLADRVSY